MLSSNGGDAKDRPSAYTSSIFSANSHHLPLIPLCLSLTLPFSYSIYTSFLSLAFECSSTFFRRWTSGRHYCCRNPRNGLSPKDCEYISLTFSHQSITGRHDVTTEFIDEWKIEKLLLYNNNHLQQLKNRTESKTGRFKICFAHQL